MVIAKSEDHATNDKYMYRNGGGGVIEKDHVEQIRSSLLSPYEVKFCDVSDDDDEDEQRRKKLSSITELDAESILSSIRNGANSPIDCKKKYPIPDGGWGWAIVFASVIISLISDGVSFSFGLLYTEFLSYFKQSPSKTSWIGSLFLAVPLMSGPIMSNLVDTYGCRRMTMIGGLIAGTGFVLASISSSVEMLYLTFGFIGGLGLGVGYVTAVVAVAIWFDKKRSFATGIGASGTGLGTFVYAPFTQWLIEYFGWRGTVLILAGTMFNICVMGTLMRDPEWLIYENHLESRSQSIQTFSNSSCNLDEIKKMLETGAKREDVLDTLVTSYNTEANQQIPVPEENSLSKKYQSEMLLPTFAWNDELKVDIRHGSWRSLRNHKLDQEAIASAKANETTKTTDAPVKRNLASMETLNPSEKESFFDKNETTKSENSLASSGSDEMYRRFSLDETAMFRNTPESPMRELKARGMSLDAVDETEQQDEVGPLTLQVPNQHQMYKDSTLTRRKRGKRHVDIKDENLKRNLSLRNSHYFRNMRIHRNSINYRGAIMNTHRYRLKASSCPNIYRNSMTTIAREEEEKWYDNFVDIMKSIFDFSLFLELQFFTLNLATLLLFIWFIVPYFYLPEHLLKHKYSEEDGANLIAVIGVFQTIGMIVLGWMGDQPWLNVAKAYGVCLFICGISVGLFPVFTYSYPMMLVLAVIFGLTFASSFSYTPIILVEIVDLDDFTIAYGLVLLVQGVGNLIGPPLSSGLYELFGQWDESFYFAGVFISIAGILAYILGIILDRDKEKHEKESNSDSDKKCSSNSSSNNNNKFNNNSKLEIPV